MLATLRPPEPARPLSARPSTPPCRACAGAVSVRFVLLARGAGRRGVPRWWPISTTAGASARCGPASSPSPRARWGTAPIRPTPTATSSAPTGTPARTTAATTTSTRSGAPTSPPGRGSRPAPRSTTSWHPGNLNGDSASFYVWGTNHGTWHPVGSGYAPQPGDVAVYGLDTAAVTAVHVAVVTAATGNDAAPDVINGDGDRTGYSVVEVGDHQAYADVKGKGAPLSGYVSPIVSDGALDVVLTGRGPRHPVAVALPPPRPAAPPSPTPPPRTPWPRRARCGSAPASGSPAPRKAIGRMMRKAVR